MTNNPRRGCGHKQKGGVYAEADAGPNGILAKLVWVLGTHYGPAYEAAVLSDLPHRKQILTDPELSLDMMAVYTEEEAEAVRYSSDWNGANNPNLRRLGRTALADYVGGGVYTPWSFAEELRDLGPSRRIAPSIARQIAGRLPLPIFFAHGSIPVFESIEHAHSHYAQWEIPLSQEHMTPTWEMPEWGICAGDYHGNDHYLIPYMRYADQNHAAAADIETYQALFCASWITRVTYYLEDGQEKPPPELQGTGIDVATLDPPAE